MNHTLTVFTPAYNRAHTIGRTYESLCRQTCKDFEWLVVDDGSKDNTRELVEGWIAENRIPIRYIYQENQGMHGAHNTAYRNITTELNTCIDSDDYMPDDAVEKIITFWKEHGSEEFAGIIGLDYTIDYQLIGDELPHDTVSITFSNLYRNRIKGDKKLVYRTSIIKRYPPYPIFKGEKYVGLDWLYNSIDQKYPLLVLNEPLVLVDYQQDGSSMNMFKQYWNNPKGFCFYRKEHMLIAHDWKDLTKTCIHYVASSIIAKNYSFIKDSPKKIPTIICIIPGSLLFFLIWYKVKKGKLMNITK